MPGESHILESEFVPSYSKPARKSRRQRHRRLRFKLLLPDTPPWHDTFLGFRAQKELSSMLIVMHHSILMCFSLAMIIIGSWHF